MSWYDIFKFVFPSRDINFQISFIKGPGYGIKLVRCSDYVLNSSGDNKEMIL